MVSQGEAPGGAPAGSPGGDGRHRDIRRVEQAITRIGRIANGREAARVRAERSGVRISRPGLAILSALDGKGPLRPTELAGLTRLELTLVSRELRRLVAEAYVVSRSDDTDGRAALATLTDTGTAALRAYRAATDEIVDETFAGWSAGELHELATTLERVVEDFARPPAGA